MAGISLFSQLTEQRKAEEVQEEEIPSVRND